MCRLYGQILLSARGAKDFLVDSDRSLLHQSNYREGNFQKDGWGFGFYNGEGEARVIKSPRPAFKDVRRFSAEAAKIRSRVVMGHLRAASNPLGLPRRRLISEENSQPYTDGRFIFAHNGTVEIPTEVGKFLGPYQHRLQGCNDSEFYFWQFRKFYDLYGDIPKALQACIQELWTIWGYCKGRYPKKTSPYTRLNTLVSDGKSLHAMCHCYKPFKLQSLFNPKQNWGTMCLARRDGRAILASEELDTGPWSHLRDPEIVSATILGSGISVRRQSFKLVR